MKWDRVGLSMTQTTQRPRPCRCLHGTDRPFSRFFSRRILAGWKKTPFRKILKDWQRKQLIAAKTPSKELEELLPALARHLDLQHGKNANTTCRGIVMTQANRGVGGTPPGGVHELCFFDVFSVFLQDASRIPSIRPFWRIPFTSKIGCLILASSLAAWTHKVRKDWVDTKSHKKKCCRKDAMKPMEGFVQIIPDCEGLICKVWVFPWLGRGIVFYMLLHCGSWGPTHDILQGDSGWIIWYVPIITRVLNWWFHQPFFLNVVYNRRGTFITFHHNPCQLLNFPSWIKFTFLQKLSHPPLSSGFWGKFMEYRHTAIWERVGNPQWLAKDSWSEFSSLRKRRILQKATKNNGIF